MKKLLTLVLIALFTVLAIPTTHHCESTYNLKDKIISANCPIKNAVAYRQMSNIMLPVAKLELTPIKSHPGMYIYTFKTTNYLPANITIIVEYGDDP